MAKGAVREEDVIDRVALDRLRVQRERLVELVCAKLLVCLRLEVLRLGDLPYAHMSPFHALSPAARTTRPCQLRTTPARATAASAAMMMPWSHHH